jgi:hypothetical protein
MVNRKFDAAARRPSHRPAHWSVLRRARTKSATASVNSPSQPAQLGDTSRDRTLTLDRLNDRPGAGESLRTLRALAVLEYAGTPEAQRLLRALAEGAPGGRLTDGAKAVCEWLDHRH